MKYATGWKARENLPFDVGLGFHDVGPTYGKHGTVWNVVQISEGDFLGK